MPTTAKSASNRSSSSRRTASRRPAPSKPSTERPRCIRTPWSRWSPSITRPTSGPTARRSGTFPCSIAVTSTPSERSEAASSAPMKPMPTRTALAPGSAIARIASASPSVRRSSTPGRSDPGSSGRLARLPVAINRASKRIGSESASATEPAPRSSAEAVSPNRVSISCSANHFSGRTTMRSAVCSPRR